MVKAMVLLHRRPGMSSQEFREYTDRKHLEMLWQLPGLRRLIINYGLPGPDGEPAYDAIGEDWFDNAEAMGAAFASPAGQALMADAPNFLDMSRFQVVVVEEQEVPAPVG